MYSCSILSNVLLWCFWSQLLIGMMARSSVCGTYTILKDRCRGICDNFSMSASSVYARSSFKVHSLNPVTKPFISQSNKDEIVDGWLVGQNGLYHKDSAYT